MDKSIILLGLKKSCVVMHGLAFSFKEEKTRSETLSLVNCISEAIKFIEQTESIAGQGVGFSQIIPPPTAIITKTKI